MARLSKKCKASSTTTRSRTPSKGSCKSGNLQHRPSLQCAAATSNATRSQLTGVFDHRKHHLRRILLRMVHGVVRGNAFILVVIIPASIQIAVETRKIAARDFDAQLMTGLKIVTGIQGLQGDLVDFSRLHPGEWLVVAVVIAEALDGFVEVVSAAIR